VQPLVDHIMSALKASLGIAAAVASSGKTFKKYTNILLLKLKIKN
jgi:hypothetical protein